MSTFRLSRLLPALCICAVVAPQVAAAQPSSNWADLDNALGREDYAKAKNLADSLIDHGNGNDRDKALMAYGRILLGLRQRDKAKAYLERLSRPGVDLSGGKLTTVYTAWLLALHGGTEEGIERLEKLLEGAGESPGTWAANAADVAAMLHMSIGEQDRAKELVDYGLHVLDYQGVKDGHVRGLLKGRLKSNIMASEAKRLYDDAESLRGEKKYREAGQIFHAIRKTHPDSSWADAAGFRIGQCFEGLGRDKDAIDWWKAFLADSPSGAWRGQAAAGLIDLLLVSRIDVNEAALVAEEASRRVSGSFEEEAESSWKKAAYGIHIRRGIISLASGQPDTAAAAFEQARSAGGGAAGGGLERLIGMSRERVSLLPEDLRSGEERFQQALVLGRACTELREFDLAAVFFGAVHSNPACQSKPHRSFALLGAAQASLRSTGDAATEDGPSPALAKARAALLASLEEYPEGPWHGETLSELGLMIERAAEASFRLKPRSPSPIAGPTNGAPASMPVLSADQHFDRDQRRKKARAEALPYWNRLIEEYPDSRYVPLALYHAGVLHAEEDDAAKAMTRFSQLALSHPDSPWAGDAFLKLVDVRLEQMFDLPGAIEQIDAALDWYERLDKSQADRSRPERVTGEYDALRSIRDIGYDIYVRAGLLEHLSDNPDRAVIYFEKAEPMQPPRGFEVVSGHIPTGIENLIDVVKSGKQLTPDEALVGDEKARLALILADVYHESQQYQRSIDICNRVIAKKILTPSPAQLSWAYFRRARNYYRFVGDDYNPDAALLDYGKAYKTAPRAPWAGNALFLGANLQWNHQQKADAAILSWRRLVREFPDSDELERSAYFIPVAYLWSDRPEQAQKEFELFLDKHPASIFAKDARMFLEEARKAQRQKKENASGRR